MNDFLTKRIVKARFDATGGKAVASYGLGVHIPSGAVVTDAYYVVRTTFTTAAADAGTIALTIQSAGDVKAAIAVSDATNVWDAGIHAGLIGSPAVGSNASTLDAGTAIIYSARKAASLLLTTAVREVTATVATQDLTAGILDLYIEYVV
jgi:hypothetical protein